MSPLAALFADAYPGATVERMPPRPERSLKSPRKSNVGAWLPLCPELQPTSVPSMECDHPTRVRHSKRASAVAPHVRRYWYPNLVGAFFGSSWIALLQSL